MGIETMFDILGLPQEQEQK